MTAADVVATYKRLTDPKGGGAALSAFKGVLQPSGVKAVGDYTVVFTLDAPTASFPYLTSNTTYQAIILPANYKDGTFTTTPQTTGAFNLTSYTPGVGAKFDRNPSWWGGKAPLDGVDVTYYADESAAVAARPERPDRHDEPDVVHGRPRRIQQPEAADRHGQGHAAPRDLDAHLRRSLRPRSSRTPSSARRWR